MPRNSLFIIVLIALLQLVVCFGELSAEPNPSKVSPRVAHLLNTNLRTTQELQEVLLWVFFVDKNPSNHDLITYADQMHPNALRRRAKVNAEVEENDLPVNQDYIKQVEALGVTMRRASKWLNAISISIKGNTKWEMHDIVERIVALPFVSKVEVVASYTKSLPVEEEISLQEQPQTIGNSKRETLAINYGDSFAQLNMIGVTDAHAQGYNGTGVVVIILDSGFMKTHPAFATMNIIAEWDYLDNDNNTQSIDNQIDHGTKTLSNLGGYAPGGIIGSGFGASFILAKTEATAYESRTEEDNFIAAVEWGESLGAEVVSASLGYTAWYTYYDMDGTKSAVTQHCDIASRKGMVVVVSAGNSAGAGISTPADGFEVIAVGSVTSTGSVSSFSSLGPAADGRTKPDVSARGSLNYVANPWIAPGANHNVNYTTASGTSFSCPLVAGVVAIILQAHPDWTPAMVKEALMQTASDAAQPSSTLGWGIVNAIAAIQYNPVPGNCSISETTCSGLGCCSNGLCQCSGPYFGRFCSYPKESCSNFCASRTKGAGQCVVQPSGKSYRCAPPTAPNTETIPSLTCEGCDTDACGVCFGYNSTCLIGCDGVLNSTVRFDLCHVCGGDNSTCTPTRPASTSQDSLGDVVVPSGALIAIVVFGSIFLASGTALALLVRHRLKTRPIPFIPLEVEITNDAVPEVNPITIN